MTAIEYSTYQAYCKARAAEGLQVIPEALYIALKGNPDVKSS